MHKQHLSRLNFSLFTRKGKITILKYVEMIYYQAVNIERSQNPLAILVIMVRGRQTRLTQIHSKSQIEVVHLMSHEPHDLNDFSNEIYNYEHSHIYLPTA